MTSISNPNQPPPVINAGSALSTNPPVMTNANPNIAPVQTSTYPSSNMSHLNP